MQREELTLVRKAAQQATSGLPKGKDVIQAGNPPKTSSAAVDMTKAKNLKQNKLYKGRPNK
jgi:hypothetical protein